jgi:hypothetical protein
MTEGETETVERGLKEVIEEIGGEMIVEGETEEEEEELEGLIQDLALEAELLLRKSGKIEETQDLIQEREEPVLAEAKREETSTQRMAQEAAEMTAETDDQ